MKLAPITITILSLLVIMSYATPYLNGDREVSSDLNEIIPLHTQKIIDFSGWERDRNSDHIDDMLSDTSLLDRKEGYFGINVHVDRPIDKIHVSKIMQKARSIGMDPNYLRTGIHTTAIYLLVKEPDRGSIDDLLFPWVSFIEYRPRMMTFLDVSSPAVRAASSDYMSPFTAEDMRYSGKDVVIAVMDTGVDNKVHESLRGKYQYGADFTGTSNIFGIDPDDVDGHGTHVAGTALGNGGIGKNYVGTAPDALLVDLKIFKSFGTILGNSDQAFEWLISNHQERDIRVVQCSFGSSVTTSGRDTTSQLANLLVEEGVVVVAAAGNMGTSGLPSPAAADKVITVGSYNDKNTVSRDDDTVEGYSNRGPRANDGDQDQMDELKPDISAPGTDIVAPSHNSLMDYTDMTGTSMACPHVSGIVALMLEANPDLSPLQIKNILKDTAEQRYNPSIPSLDMKYNYRSGWGEIDAYGAVKRARDLLELEIESPLEVRSNEPVSIASIGKFTKTSFDTDTDLYTMDISTPYSWGIHREIVYESGSSVGSTSYSGPIRRGDNWVTEMEVYYNSSVEEAEPVLSVTIIPTGYEGESATVRSTCSINGMKFSSESKVINITQGPAPPDISVTPFSIWFSDPLPNGGDIIDITVRVNNTGGRTAIGAVVRILDGPELSGDVIGEVQLDIAPSSYGLAITSWIANPGIHAITAVLDPDDLIAESNEDNNSAERPLTVRGINPPPIAQLDVDPKEGTTTTRFVFDGSSSRDTNIRGGNVVFYRFDFGDGRSSGWVETSVIEHRYLSGGSFTASLTVKDNGGEESTNEANVILNVTDVSSQRDTLYLNSSMGLSNSPGPSSELPIGTTNSMIGEWRSDPLEKTKVYHSTVSILLMVNSSEATYLDYTVSLTESGGSSVSESKGSDMGTGRNLINIEFKIDEMEVKADNEIFLNLQASVQEGEGNLITGDESSFMDILFYHPINEPPVVEVGEDIEVRVGENVEFNGVVTDPDGEIQKIRWDVDEDEIFDHEGSDSFIFEGYEEEGIYNVLLEARDDDGEWGHDTLEAIVRPADYNFPPKVTVRCTYEVTGVVIIEGTATDDSGVQMVEISILKKPENQTVIGWKEVDGTDQWQYEFDSRGIPDGEYNILARAFDGAAYSEVATCPIIVENPNTPPEIVDARIDPASFVYGQSIPLTLELDVIDPDLPADSIVVTADLSSMGESASLYLVDDGRGVDEKEGDGIYSAGFRTSPIIEPGVYDIKFQAEDSRGEIDQKLITIEVIAEVDAIVTISPRNPSSGDEVFVEVRIDSPVDVRVTARSDLFDGTTIELGDDGMGGDKIYGDFVFSATTVIEGEPGKHPVMITIEDIEGKVLLVIDEKINIAGTPSDPSISSGSELLPNTLLIIILITVPVAGSLVLVFTIRRKEKKKIYSSLPFVAIMEDDYVSEGDLPVQGEMPEIAQYGHYANDKPSEQGE